MEYASKGVANTALGLSIGAVAVEALGGALGNILGGGMNNTCHENTPVNRYEAAQSARIAQLETEVKLRDANTYTDSKLLEQYKFFDGEIRRIDRELCDQKVLNATQIGTISCIQGQIAQLMGLTRLTIPNASVCPGWGDVTVTVTPTTTTTGA